MRVAGWLATKCVSTELAEQGGVDSQFFGRLRASEQESSD